MKRIFGWLLFGLALLAALFWAYQTQPSFREVAIGGFGLLASVFTSPFILEATLAFIGLIIVMTYNQRRLQKEGQDEWVVMKVDRPEQEAAVPSEKNENG